MTGSTRLIQMSGAVADLIYWVAAIPRSGEEAVVTDFAIHPGGGFNAMVAARRAGMDVAYAGSLGTGVFAEIVLAGLTAEHIPALLPCDPHHDQGCCTVMIEPSGERTFVASHGAEGHLAARDLARISWGATDWSLLSGYSLYYPGSCGTLSAFLGGDAVIQNLVFDPSPVVAELPPEAIQTALTRASWVSANRREAAVLTGMDDPTHSALALAMPRDGRGGAVVRDGERGCIVAVGATATHIAPHRVDPIDTNGAGDAHLGSFIAELAAHGDPIAAARYANIAAAMSTTFRGPSTAPARKDVTCVLKTGGPKKEAAMIQSSQQEIQS